jgi:Carbamoylphosphate synthase small subunit
MVCMTYPLIGNYGVNAEDVESHKVGVEAFIVKECCKEPSNWRATMSLPEYLKKPGSWASRASTPAP